MKKILSLLLILLFSTLSFISCSKAEIKETSNAGAYCLMFDILIENNVDITAFKYLSFDKKSCQVEGEELDILTNHIKEYCEDEGVEYIEKSKVELRRGFKINSSIYGEEFSEGYLLYFSPLDSFKDSDDNTYYTAEINFWHGDMDGVGGRDFFIVKTSDGWYLDREKPNGGYSTMLQ